MASYTIFPLVDTSDAGNLIRRCITFPNSPFPTSRPHDPEAVRQRDIMIFVSSLEKDIKDPECEMVQVTSNELDSDGSTQPLGYASWTVYNASHLGPTAPMVTKVPTKARREKIFELVDRIDPIWLPQHFKNLKAILDVGWSKTAEKERVLQERTNILGKSDSLPPPPPPPRILFLAIHLHPPQKQFSIQSVHTPSTAAK